MRDIINSVSSINILNTTLEHDRAVARRFEEVIQRLHKAHAPQLTILPSLAQYNFIRALQENIKVFGLSADQLDDDALSPFNAGGRWNLLPIPEMRDNLFRKGLDSFDEEELCHALRGRVKALSAAQHVVFELQVPKVITAWRDTTAYVIS
ncbi:hypothetical protein MY3296_008776 [Beauveria thailandica]